jgi:deoxyribodipyrimidine photo-lyase
MKQLLQTGWMHNRLRMVTAAFLTKILLIDWRKGEAFFMQHLLDGDYASNNGGWQWAASTGADAAPYFRIFNPERQSERFDKEGIFIKKLLPELAPINAKNIHTPPSDLRLAHAYPEPIIDYKWARQRALDSYATAMGKA